MHILGIETSCDDTCVAILKIENCLPASEFARRRSRAGKVKILSNLVASQVKIHQKYGGVYPFLAKREHQRNLALTFIKALKEARLLNSKFKIQNSKLQLKNKNLNKTLSRKIDFIGVTVGPGLEPCLWQGINFAKDLAKKFNLPIVPVNHIEAHLLANFVGENSKFKIQNSKLFPAICLVVSGGHTQLILIKGIGKYKLIGETRDDAAGECFDKTARILGLGYPGGPAIARVAEKAGRGPSSTFSAFVKLPRPMLNQKNYDFSFSGLKTAVLYQYQKSKIKNQKFKRAMAAEIQQAIIDVLIKKTIKAAKDFGAKSIILGGGVAANNELRKQFKTACLKFHFKHLVPQKKFCTDNAVMIAFTAFFQQKKATKDWQKIKANANLNIG